jgi:hypothetical protein
VGPLPEDKAGLTGSQGYRLPKAGKVVSVKVNEIDRSET